MINNYKCKEFDVTKEKIYIYISVCVCDRYTPCQKLLNNSHKNQ